MSQFDPIVILSYARTPMGGMQGALGEVSASHLGAVAVKAAVERAGVAGADVERIYMGNVLSAGQGQAPARQAAIFAGLPQSVEATTVNKMCGSGMQAAIMGAEALAAGSIDIIVAGGMESMTNAPYLLPKMRSGARLGHTEAKDHMFLDGLEDAYEPGRAMGSFAEETVGEYQLTREAQDDFSIESLARAKAAVEGDAFDDEVVAVEVKTRKGDVTVDKDEQPLKGNPDKIPQLRAAFAKDGTITAANASSISDGAAAMVLTRASVAEAKGLKPVARIVAHAAHAHAPSKFTTAPVFAIQKLLDKAGWSVADVDLWEVNEAFACVRHVRHAGSWHQPRQVERQWRRDGSGSPDRRQRCADHGDIDCSIKKARPEKRRRSFVHRRRGSYGSRAGIDRLIYFSGSSPQTSAMLIYP